MIILNITQQIFYFLIVLLCLSGCKSRTNATDNSRDKSISTAVEFSKDSLLHHIKVLSSDAFEGRRTGTEGALKARNYITSKFKNLGILPLLKSYHQPFTFTSRDKKNYNGINVLGYIRGAENPEKYIVISAHYDHLGVKDNIIFNGADDDASGTSALFSFAEYFIKNPPKHSVILAAFDAEEMGLKGSKYFVDNPIITNENIVVNLNMDMISRSDTNELYVVGTRFYENLKPAITAVKLPENFKVLIGHDGSDDKQNWTNSSDHGSFHKKRIPFLYFGVEDHKDYHKETDEFENIHPEFYANAVNVIISVFQDLDGSLK